MIDAVISKIFGTKNEREIKAMRPVIAAINDLEPHMQTALGRGSRRQNRRVSRNALPTAKPSTTFSPKLSPSAAKAGRRVLNMRHFDVQLIGGIVLHRGKIAEMKTGEGKTLVATLPVYLNALDRQRRSRRHRQRLPRQTRRRMDGPPLQVPRPHRRHHRPRSRRPGTQGTATTATSPTAPTTSSASTTCATT